MMTTMSLFGSSHRSHRSNCFDSLHSTPVTSLPLLSYSSLHDSAVSDPNRTLPKTLVFVLNNPVFKMADGPCVSRRHGNGQSMWEAPFYIYNKRATSLVAARWPTRRDFSNFSAERRPCCFSDVTCTQRRAAIWRSSPELLESFASASPECTRCTHTMHFLHRG